VIIKERLTTPHRPSLPKIRKILAQKLVNGYGVSLAETARQLGVLTLELSQMLHRRICMFCQQRPSTNFKATLK
jgi:hypothetical protein